MEIKQLLDALTTTLREADDDIDGGDLYDARVQLDVALMIVKKLSDKVFGGDGDSETNLSR